MEVDRPFFLQGLRITSRTNGLPLNSHPKKTQSISMTSPVLRIRICIAFCKLKKASAQVKPRGKSKEEELPLSWSFQGSLQRGKAPTRIQRSDSCGKRRNNGTDEACPPQAADRMRDVEFVPTQIPLCHPFFRLSTALSFPCGKESGVEPLQRNHSVHL